MSKIRCENVKWYYNDEMNLHSVFSEETNNARIANKTKIVIPVFILLILYLFQKKEKEE